MDHSTIQWVFGGMITLVAIYTIYNIIQDVTEMNRIQKRREEEFAHQEAERLSEQLRKSKKYAGLDKPKELSSKRKPFPKNLKGTLKRESVLPPENKRE
jgi:hypothetical protein